MLKSISNEIVRRVLSEYQSDFSGFCSEVMLSIEIGDPVLFQHFIFFFEELEKDKGQDWLLLGVQYSCVVYRCLELSTGALPRVEQKVIDTVKHELLTSKTFCAELSKRYVIDRLLPQEIVLELGWDSLGHGIPDNKRALLLTPILCVIRELELQFENQGTLTPPTH